MKEYTNPIAIQVCNILRPLIGDMMAGGVIKAQADKLGLAEEALRQEHIIPLAENIERGLIIFLGTQVAKQVGDRIRGIK